MRLGATRVGHGIRLADLLGSAKWPQVLDDLRAKSVHLEVCPTSNLHTGTAASIAMHPIRALWDAGVSLSFHSDNRLMSRTSASQEALALVTEAGFGWDDLRRMGQDAAYASFLPQADIAGALRALAAETKTP